MIITIKELNAPLLKVDLGSSMLTTVEEAMKMIAKQVNASSKKRLFPAEGAEGGESPRSEDPAVAPLWKLHEDPNSGDIKQLVHSRYGNIVLPVSKRKDMILKYVSQGDTLTLVRSQGPVATLDILSPAPPQVEPPVEEAPTENRMSESEGGFLRPSCHIRCPFAVVTDDVSLNPQEPEGAELKFSIAFDRSVPSTAPIVQAEAFYLSDSSKKTASTVSAEDFAASSDVASLILVLPSVSSEGKDTVCITIQQVASCLGGGEAKTGSFAEFQHLQVQTTAEFVLVPGVTRLRLSSQAVQLAPEASSSSSDKAVVPGLAGCTAFKLHPVFGDDDSGGIESNNNQPPNTASTPLTATPAFTEGAAAVTECVTAGGAGPVCTICITDHSNVVILPCNHRCLCSGCSTLYIEKAKICPMCRGPVEDILKL